MGWVDLETKFKPSVVNLSSSLPFGKTKDFGPYVCLHMKVRGFDYRHLETITPAFLDCIRELSKKFKIVLLGEREIGMNKEYIIHGNSSIYSLYPIISASGIEIIGLTVPEMGLTTPSLESFRIDCKYMAGAVTNINIGIGGNTIISSSLGKSISLQRNEEFARELRNCWSKIFPNILTDNVNEFFDIIRNIK